MPNRLNAPISRRNFLKWSGAAAAAATAGGRTPVLHALVPANEPGTASQVEHKFSVCGMCLNKCGLIARVEDGVVTKLDPNPKFLKSRGMLCRNPPKNPFSSMAAVRGLNFMVSPNNVTFPTAL